MRIDLTGFVDHLRSINPYLPKAAIARALGFSRQRLGAIEAKGTIYTLSAKQRAALGTFFGSKTQFEKTLRRFTIS